MKHAPTRKAGEIVTIPKVRGSWRLLEPTGHHAQGGYALWHAENVETGRRTTVRESNISGHVPAPRKVAQRDVPKLSSGSGSGVGDEPRDDKGRWTK